MTDDEKFADEFSFKTIIYDPKDRKVINTSDEKQSTDTKAVRKLIKEMPKADSQNFNAPFTEKAYFLFNSMIDDEYKAIFKIVKEHIKQAKIKGDEFTDNFEETS